MNETSQAGGVTFFVPCLNEEGNVGRCIDRIAQTMKEMGGAFEIIVVDDASTDGTIAEVEGSRRRHPDVRIELIRNPFTRGLGRNYFVAAQKARHEYYMMLSGDASEPPETLRAILSLKGQADAIVPYYGWKESRTFLRRVLSGSFTFCVNLLSGHRLRYYNGTVLHKTENVQLWYAETSGFGYQAELLCRLLDEGISVKEIQVTNSERQRGGSKALRPKNVLSVSNSLFHIGLRRLVRVVFPKEPTPTKRGDSSRQI